MAGQEDMLTRPYVVAGLEALGKKLELDANSVKSRARKALGEMWSVHQPLATRAWDGLGRRLTARYDLHIRPQDIARVAALDQGHPIIALFSHRSYLDAWLLQAAVQSSELSPMHVLAGANLDFWPMGSIVRRTGALFIRRDSKDDPIYRLMLRLYIRYLLDTGSNLSWSIEGGRTRTGKLRPPRYGALRYVIDALRESEGPEAYVVPVSVVYDQLEEVAVMATEALGAGKRPEGLGWLARFIMMQQQSARVMARVDFGEPLPLRSLITELDDDPEAGGRTVERIALQVCHGLNRVTPATPTALVTVALLASERSLTLDEVRLGIEPIIKYLSDRPNAEVILEPALVEDREWVAPTLEQLRDSGIVDRFDEGEEPVFRVAPDQHLIAAFYRNTVIHFFVTRAIGELGMFQVRGQQQNLREAFWAKAIRLRELLKFEFFFAGRRDFERELMAEAARIDPEWEGRNAARPLITPDRMGLWFERARPYVAHLVLRPFFDAYLVVAQELAKQPVDEPVDQKTLLQRCIGVGRQRVLQRRIHSEESVTLELFKTAFQLIEHLGLTKSDAQDLDARRRRFAQELETIVQDLAELAATDGVGAGSSARV